MATIRSTSISPNGTVFVEIIKDDGGTHRLSIEPGANVAARVAQVSGLSFQDALAIEGTASGVQSKAVVDAYKADMAAKAIPAVLGVDPIAARLEAIEARLAAARIP